MTDNIKERLDALEDAHRALTAQHTALIEVFKLIAPLMNMNRALMRPMLTIPYDTVGELMQADGQDAEYQAAVRHWLDVLSARVLEDKSDDHPNRGE